MTCGGGPVAVTQLMRMGVHYKIKRGILKFLMDGEGAMGFKFHAIPKVFFFEGLLLESIVFSVRCFGFEELAGV